MLKTCIIHSIIMKEKPIATVLSMKKRDKRIQLAFIWQKNNEDAYFLSRANAGIAHIYLDTIQPGMAKPFLLEAISFAQKSKKKVFMRWKCSSGNLQKIL